MSELTDDDFREMHERSNERCIGWEDPRNYMYRHGFRVGVRIAQADAESASLKGGVVEFDDIRDGDTIRRTVTHTNGTVTVITGVADRRDPFAAGYVLTSDGTILANRSSPVGTQTLELLGRNEPEAGQYIWITEFKGEKLSEPILGRVSALGFDNGVDTLDRFPDGSTWATPSEVTAWKPAKVGGLDG